jgi:hypothetical protein
MPFVYIQLSIPQSCIRWMRSTPVRVVWYFGCARATAWRRVELEDASSAAQPLSSLLRCGARAPYIAGRQVCHWLTICSCATVIDGLRPRKSGSHQTRPWREQDSNHRSRVTRPIFQVAFGWFPPTESRSEREPTHEASGPSAVPIEGTGLSQLRHPRACHHPSMWAGVSGRGKRTFLRA